MTSLFRHASLYAVGNALTTVASLVSFPILTRLLSVADYGLMNTVTLTLTLLVAIGKLGMQRATVRFYHESRAQPGTNAESTLASTLVLGMLGVGVLTTAVWAIVVTLLPADWLGAPELRALLLLTSSLVLIRVFDSALSNLLYAEERSAFLSAYGVVKRYLTLAAVVGGLVLLAHSATIVFVATIAAEVVALVWIGYVVFAANTIRPAFFSEPLLRRMIAFGVPMVGVEMAWSLLAVGDRYVIQHLMGAEAVGIYSASYNLCEYIKTSTMVALSTAVAPMYMRIWEHEGRAATEQFLGRYARSYLAFSFFVSSLVTANAEAMVTIMASSKYVGGTVIVPWVMAGMALESYVAIAAAGLFLKKRTGSIFWLVAAAAVVNIALNFALIPHLGLSGAAIATLVTFAALLATALIAGRGELSIPFPAMTLVVSSFAFGASCWIASRVKSGSPWIDIVLHTAIVVVLYGGITLALDARLRESVREMVPLIRAKLSRRAT